MRRSLPAKAGILLLLATLAGGCAVREHLQRGDGLLKKGRYTQAIEAYEEALRVEPGHEGAHDRIRMARRQHVRATLGVANQALSDGDLAKALKWAMRARRLPLDLEDVDLVKRIDASIEKAATVAEERVASFAEKGHFLSAVDLSRQIVKASPGVESREKWGEAIEKQAREHYISSAKSLQKEGLHGSAAIQLAFARRAGAEVTVDQVQDVWNRFSEPTCFGEPTVQVVDKSGKARDLVAKIQTTALSELNELRERCGEGSRKLGVRILLRKVDVVDDTKSERAAKPLPGVDVKTEEVYYEEEKYTAVEEYTDYEIRIEKQKKRDCAPRPGKPRGCRNWVEDVEIKTPVTKTREVEKVRKVRKTRPIKGPLPEDKVLAYQVTTVKRSVAYEGSFELTGAASTKGEFSVQRASSDSSNERAEAKGVVVEADPLEVQSLSSLVAEAAAAVADEIKKDVGESVKAWAKGYEETARKRQLKGQLPQAEEVYLKLLALGVDGSKPMAAFFEERYGRPIGAVMDVLVEALGREVETADTGARRRRRGAFPKRGVPERATKEEPKPEPPNDEASSEAPASESPAEEKTPASVEETAGMSEDEMKALEEASLEAADPAAKKATEAAAEGEEAEEGETKDEKKKDGAEEEEKGAAKKPIVPSRRPVAPPKAP